MNGTKWFFHQESGFTFVEIVVTIIIIGVLAVTVAVQIINMSDSAKSAKCIANQSAIKSTLLLYLAQNAEYPEDIDDLAPYFSGGFIPECPSGGSYSLVDDDEVVCSYPGH